VISTLLGGFAVWGGIGWSLDLWWGTRLMTPIGLVVGMALGIYAVVARASAGGRVDPVPKTATPAATASKTSKTSITGAPSSASTRRETECP
jgi:hypothetical protein